MRILSVLAAALTLCACKPSLPPQNEVGNSVAAVTGTASPAKTVPLRIVTASGTRPLTAEVAVTKQEQAHGLMHRTSLPPGHAMLFPFTLPRMVSFWMKDTPLPLDLLFMRPDGTITTILHGKPDDLHPLAANEPVSAVVEIGGGEAQRLGIAPGDRIEWGDCREGRQQPGVPINPLAFCAPAP